MKFTQFVRPHGRQEQITIDRPEDVERLAGEMANAGIRFEAEVLRDGTVSFEICREDADGENETLAMCLVSNGPRVPSAVDALVREAHQAWKEAA
jgi:hypothetical protein